MTENATGVIDAADTPVETGAADTSGAEVVTNGIETITDPAKPADDAAKPSDEIKGYWPDDWRQRIAGEDKKTLEKLGRYDTPAAVAKALNEAQAKISEGIKAPERPDPADEKAMAEYRAKLKLPETPEKFIEAMKLPDGRSIGDEDKPLVEAFAKRFFNEGKSPDDIAVAVDEYYRIQEEAVNQQAEADAEFKRESDKVLKEEWGGDYKANVNAMRPFFETVNRDLFDNLMTGRMADGSLIGNHPDIVRFFVAKALQENPAATVVPAGSNQIETINTEIAALEKEMRNDRDAWFKNEPGQARYRQLLEAQEKLSGK